MIWMMNKNLTISLIIIVLIVLGGLAYWQYNLKQTVNNNKNTNVNNTTELDTSDWVSFTDKVMYVKYMSPAGHCNHGVTHMYIPSSMPDCDKEAIIEYSTLLPIEGYEQYFEKLEDNKKSTLGEIANAIYEYNLNNDNPNIPKDRLITPLKRIDLNGLEAYQFTIDFSYSYVVYEDDNWVSMGGHVLHTPTRYTYVSNTEGTKFLEIKNISKDNKLADEVLNTFEFID